MGGAHRLQTVNNIQGVRDFCTRLRDGKEVSLYLYLYLTGVPRGLDLCASLRAYLHRSLNRQALLPLATYTRALSLATGASELCVLTVCTGYSRMAPSESLDSSDYYEAFRRRYSAAI